VSTRGTFLLAVSGLGGLAALPALASGGRDVEGRTESRDMRVLLTSDPEQAPSAHAIGGDAFEWAGRRYRGRFESVALPDGRIGLVDIVPVDAYLYGVVGKEVGSRWPRASLEAQAIVARTYSLLKQRPGQPYDVRAGEGDQVYAGVASESTEVLDAVDATAGRIVTFGNRTAHVAYGSCCGGHTADAAELWGAAYPYLRGVVDPHCAGAPEFHWEREVPYDEFVRALGATIAGIGDLDRVDLRDPDTSGRARRVTLIGETGQVDMKGPAFRTALGTALVRSTLILSVRVERPDTVAIAGAGHGHGAGLCQWGARFMAQDGADAREIVSFYFPGTVLGST